MATSTFYDNIVIGKEGGEILARILREPPPPYPEPNSQNEFLQKGDERLKRLHLIGKVRNMAMELEIRERQKNHLFSLLTIKAANNDGEVVCLQDELKRAIAPMEQEDIAWVEKLAGVKVL